MAAKVFKVWFFIGCITAGPFAAHANAPFIVLQSTTSTQNSGLFDYLLPMYRDLSGVEVRAVAAERRGTICRRWFRRRAFRLDV